MINVKWFRCCILVMLQCVGSIASHVTNTFQYEAENLQSDAISARVYSEIPGTITWTFTDDTYMTVTIEISANDIDNINNTEISFLSEMDTVDLYVQNKPIASAHAPVTGSGSQIHLQTALSWVPFALVFGWRPIYFTFLVLVTSQTMVQTTYMGQEPHAEKHVKIEIRAPRRFQYTDVDLYIENGTISVEEFGRSQIKNPACRTSLDSPGCPFCCHGNGLCKDNKCVCSKGFDQATSCESRSRQNIFYSHPMDPRLETTVLPTGATITLSRSYNTPEAETLAYLQYPDNHVMDVYDKDTKLKTHRILFSSDGFIEQVDDLYSNSVNRMRLKRNRVNPCKINAVFTNSDTEDSFRVLVCDTGDSRDESNGTYTKRDLQTRKEKHVQKRSSPQRRKRKTRNKAIKSVNSSLDIIEIPVITERCGYKSDDLPNVNIKLTPIHPSVLQPFSDTEYYNEIDHSSETKYRITGNGFTNTVVIPGHRNTQGDSVIRLPDIKTPLGKEAIQSKCKETLSVHNRICSAHHKHVYYQLCSSVFVHKNATNMETQTHDSNIFQYSNLCHFASQLLITFCDRNLSKVLSKESVCQHQYPSSVNLFSVDYYKFSPFAVYSDGKTVPGKELGIFLANVDEVLRDGIRILDKKPTFKIDRITVIPKDPVPHDIYQVRLEYSCATNSTVIKMTVTGSDKYSNHVTCHGGISSSGLCTLHAAGAPDAVVDEVTITVKDPFTGLELTKDMVVIF